MEHISTVYSTLLSHCSLKNEQLISLISTGHGSNVANEFLSRFWLHHPYGTQRMPKISSAAQINVQSVDAVYGIYAMIHISELTVNRKRCKVSNRVFAPRSPRLFPDSVCVCVCQLNRKHFPSKCPAIITPADLVKFNDADETGSMRTRKCGEERKRVIILLRDTTSIASPNTRINTNAFR